MAKYGKKSKRSGVLFIVLLFAIIIIVGVAFQATNGFSTALKSFHVIYKEDYILNNKKGLIVQKGDVFEIKQYTYDKEKISVEIYAIESKAENTVFSYSGVTTSWNESVANKNVTGAFEIKIENPRGEENGTVTIVKGDVFEVIRSFVGDEEIVLDKGFSIAEDMFRMVLTVGDEQMLLDFTMQIPPVEFIIDEESLIF